MNSKLIAPMAKDRAKLWSAVADLCESEATFYSTAFRNTWFRLALACVLGFARRRVAVWQDMAK